MDVIRLFFSICTGIFVARANPLTQEELNTLANTMSIRAKMLYNLRDNEKSHTFRIYLKNIGNTNIPASGWKLYFHSMYILYPGVFPKNMTVELKIEHIRVGMIQGDLYYLEPSSGFVDIKQNEEREYDIEAAWWSISRTDFMPHWYIVTEDASVEPRVVNTTDSLGLEYIDGFDDVRQWKRFAADRYNPFTAQERARRYEAVDKGKVQKLVIPTPLDIDIDEDVTLPHLNNSWKIFSAVDEYQPVADYLGGILGIETTNSPHLKNSIILNTTDIPESYIVQIDPPHNIIHLMGKDLDGIFYAAQTLRSILDGYNRKDIPKVTILDKPRFKYRGMHIDVARNFHSLDDTKRLIKAMAMYKMNKLHLHLSDDEGWRLEIPGLPELTEIGGRRCHDMSERTCIIPQFGSGPANTTSGSGFFTTEDYKELLQFAKIHHIQVLPEFDMPGHAHAAIASMEERYRRYHEKGNDIEANKYRLVDPDDTSEYISVQQWLDNAINPCVDSAYTFIGKVMDEVKELHKEIQPLEVYNFGGDEVANHAWENSPKCLDFIQNNADYNVTKGIKMYFVEKVSMLAAERNLSLAGWEDGFADGNHDPMALDKLETENNFAIPWNNIWEWGGGSQAYRLANAGYKVILAQATNIYFDQPQEPDPEERGLYWATRFTDTLKVLKFMPDSLYDNIFEERSGKPTTKYNICGQDMSKCEPLEKKENVIGIQGELWSETVRSGENVDYMIFPRLVALAERAWHKADFEDDSISDQERDSRFKHEWEAFANTLGYKELKRLDDLDVMYRVPPPGARVSQNDEVVITTTFPGLRMQYSHDNGTSWLNVTSGESITWREDATLHLRTVSANGARFSRIIQVYKDEPQNWSDQHVIDYIAENINVHVEVIDNLKKEENYMLLKLQLRNDGTKDVPDGTWRLYFYSLYGGKTESLDCGLKVGHENGGLFYFTPDAGVFPGIGAGKALTCQYHNKYWMVARTDNMPNWYVTSLGMKPQVIKSTTSQTLDYVGKFDTPAKWKRTMDDKYDPYSPATRYDLYKTSDTKQRPYKVVPTPLTITVQDDSETVFSPNDWVVIESADFPFEAQYLSDNLNVNHVTTEPGAKFVKLVKRSPSENDPEAYDLSIDAKASKVTVIANSTAGAFYGAQSLISLIQGDNGRLVKMTIKDRPRYKYRGVMLDTSRNFKPKDWILEFLDVMSMYKLNKLHFHLTDDEGWRVEIPKIPELTEVASKRCHSDYKGVCTIPQLGSGPDTKTSGSGFYSIEEYREILQYANDRHIEVIPEIDIPGHSAAAIAAMEYRESQILKMKQHGNQDLPESLLLSKHVGKNDIFSPQKWTRNAIDPCLNTSYRFVETVIDGLIYLHQPVQPLKLFHLGGDEVASGVWNDSKACIGSGKPIDTNQLQRMFAKRVADIVADKNLNLASWDDGIYAGNQPNPITDYRASEVYAYPWDNRGVNTKRPSEFANEGYKVVLPLATHLYFDQAQGPDPEERGLYWASRFTDTQKSFGLMPDNLYANIDLDRFGNKIDVNSLCGNNPCPRTNKTENIVGIQACMWAETMRTRDQFHYMAFPRLLALAERAWHKAPWEDISDVEVRNPERDRDWKEFSDNLGYKELQRLGKNNYFYRIPPPGARVEDGKLKVNTKYTNLMVDISQDNGKTWTMYKEAKLNPGSQTFLLRSRSALSDFTSRHIEVETVSSAGETSSGISMEELNTLANTMSIRAEMLYNLRDNEKSHTFRIYLKNTGNTNIPASGWKLYFHSMYILYPGVFPKNMTVELKIEHIRVGMIQGDLYYLEPSSGFVEIKQNEEREYDIEAAWWSISRTDFMPHWYIVSEDASVEPRVVNTTDSLGLEYVDGFDDVRQWKRFAADRYNPFTAQERARRYEAVDKGKVQKLVIPTPLDIDIDEDVTLPHLNNSWKIFSAVDEYQPVADYLGGILGIQTTNSPHLKNSIILNTTDIPESYIVQIDPPHNIIHLMGKDLDGIFYAAQTLRSILDGYNRKDIPKVTILDKPRFQYRGMHIDVARNFHSLDDTKRLIKAMAMYKMNKLHLHLSDDEGWRLEIPGLPELTEIGGRRCHDMSERTCIIPQFGSGPANTTSGSGFFTTEDYKELLQFAKIHHIQVLPEFDMPGHAHAAIASMEERYRRYHEKGNDIEANRYRLVDPDDTSEYISVQQWLDNAINPCVDSAYTFIGKVMDEVKELHKEIQPLEVYNFGGDEVANHAWENSPKCLDVIQNNADYNVTKGIKMYFVEKVSMLAAERNLSLAGWEDGFADGNHDPMALDKLETENNFAIPWNNIWEWGGGSQAYRLANAGYKVILAQATNIYFDQPQEPDPEERGLYWATRFTDTLKVLKFMPDSLYDNIFEERSGKPTTKYDICGQDMSKCEPLEKKENVIGIQGELWSETVRSGENVDYMIFPRLVALAERAWHKADFEDDSISDQERDSRFKLEWEAFANTLGYKELKRLDDLDVMYRVPPPGARVSQNDEVVITTTFPGLRMQYSHDNGTSWLNVTSGESITWREDATLHLRTVSANGARFSRIIQVYKYEPQNWSDQHVIDYIAENINVHVEVIDNLNKEDNYMLLKLQLRNDGTKDVPDGTWRLYFYSLYGGKTESLDCGLKVGHENGGLFYFTPDAGVFPGIGAGKTLTCQYHNKYWMVARTDNMPNWYVTSLGMKPQVIKSTTSQTLDYVGKFDTPAKWKRTKDDKYDPYSPATRYDLYKTSDTKQRPYKVVPTPLTITVQDDSETVFSPNDWVVIESADFPFEAQYLSDSLNVSHVTTEPGAKFVKLVKGSPSENDPEAYDLNIDAKASKVTVIANSTAGAFYGAQSLISLIQGDNGRLVKMTIKDRPRYKYRGVMLDTSRNFKPKYWILEFLDVMSMYKLNKLHFHLTDDEGWRVEIPKIPELTEVASKRCHSDYKGVCTIPQLGSGPDTKTSGSGFYSIKEYREILQYANDRHIEVIPEIDIPGHSAAAIAAMEYRESQILKMKQHGNQDLPESLLLSKHVGKNDIFSPQKWTRNAIDPCLNTSYRFVETVIDGLIDLHQPVQPLKLFHLGGDEVASGVWNDSKACIGSGKPIDTNQLQRMFAKRVADIVADKNLNLASWDDGIYAGNQPNPITDYRASEVYAYPWDNRGVNTKRPSEFANEGYKVVLPLATHLYFDQAQGPDPEERGLYWAARFTDTQKSFGLMPDNLYANIDLDRFGNKIDVNSLCGNNPCPRTNKTENIVGIQACMWAETMRTRDQFHYMAFPRLLALAERAWHKAPWEDISDVEVRNPERDRDWKEFSDNLGYKELQRLGKHNYFYRIPPPGARVEDGKLKVNTKYANLMVDISQDNGKTWTMYKEAKLNPGSQTFLLRSRSALSDFTSRHIEVETTTVSSARETSSGISMVLLALFCYFIHSLYIR